jgi:DNA recombination protein RmuC
MVTARRMHEIGVADSPLPETAPVETAPRPLTAAELIDALEPAVARPELDLGPIRNLGAARDAGATSRTA